ncbi:MAG: hypothetical protein IJO43_00530 [Bacilli bacterium]|nr:hypothetical protein [Bacilli bacterium]
MSIAILGKKLNNSDEITTIDSSSLRQIDNVTRLFANEEELKNSDYYQSRMSTSSSVEKEEGKLIITYVKNNQEKINLDVIYDNSDAIRTRTSSLEEVSSEVEKSRKLLLNSKNQIFLTSFLLNKKFLPTTSATVRMTIDEYKIAKKEGYQVSLFDGEYRISIQEVLKYRLNHKKLGGMRLLVEDSLEVWKKNMLNLSDEDLYFYSRELRLLLNEYNYRKIPRKAVVNLSFDKSKIKDNLKIRKKNDFRIKAVGLPKRKVLDDRKAA